MEFFYSVVRHHMKSRFLVQKVRRSQQFLLNCSMLSDVVVADSEDRCLALLKEKLNDFLITKGKEYVNQFKSADDGKVNCPDGFVLLPLDAWHCKQDKASCALQASIDSNDKDGFVTHCRAGNKESIFKAIEQQAYTGFHHVPGRYLCPSCDYSLKESQQNFKYHYPWELYPLWECINFEDKTVMSTMYDLDIPSSIRHSKVCAPCFLKLINQLFPGTPDTDNLFVLVMDFFPR